MVKASLLLSWCYNWYHIFRRLLILHVKPTVECNKVILGREEKEIAKLKQKYARHGEIKWTQQSHITSSSSAAYDKQMIIKLKRKKKNTWDIQLPKT